MSERSSQPGWSYSRLQGPPADHDYPLTGFNIFPLANLRSTLSSAAPHSTPDVTPHLHIPTSSPVDHLHFAMSEKIVVAGMRDATIGVWRLKSLAEGNVSRPRLYSHHSY